MKINMFMSALLGGLIMTGSASAATLNEGDKILIAYYSLSGNTRTIAEDIQQTVGGDIFEIKPVSAYPEEYRQVTERAKKEISEGYKPALQGKVADLNSYDVIFVGSPCWWSTMAPPVASFLSEYDFSGKKIIPFMTHGGSGFGHTLADIKALAPNAEISGGQTFLGSRAGQAQEDVKEWLKGLQND